MGDLRRTHWHVRFSFCFLFISLPHLYRTYSPSRHVCLSGPELRKTALLFLQKFFSIYIILYRKFLFKFIQRLHSNFIYTNVYISFFFSFWFLQRIRNANHFYVFYIAISFCVRSRYNIDPAIQKYPMTANKILYENECR